MATHEAMKGAGFSDWHRALRDMGHYKTAAEIERIDPGNTAEGNAHTVIARRLESIGLPVQAHIDVSLRDFVSDPYRYLDRIHQGDYYFASIVPGVHLAHGTDPAEVIAFAHSYAMTATEKQLDASIYISHNGEPVMSGHIIVKDDAEPNTISCEFTTGNFNAFHRGSHTPEISVQRHDRRFAWEFRDSLAGEDWRDCQLFPCQGGVELTRTTMATRIYDAISRIPHDGDYYLPGYYEVLLERAEGDATKPVFIEANLRGLI